MKSKSDAVVEAPQGSDTAYNISFWRVLLLCIPALILGAALRASFLAVTPEVYYQTDTYSYFMTASKLLTEGDFKVNPKRSFLYPILLVLFFQAAWRSGSQSSSTSSVWQLSSESAG